MQLLFFLIFKNLFIFEREAKRQRDRAQAGEGQREGVTESIAGFSPRAVSTESDAGLELKNCKIMT